MSEVEKATGAELAQREEELVAGALAGIDSEDLALPVLKVTQQLSGEVTRGDAESGQFVNSITGDVYGDSVDFVVVHYFKGRFYAPEDEERVYVAQGEIAPSNWPDGLAGKRFADLPLAEEQWKARSNDPDDDQEWGSGPPIQTTRNFIGFVTEDPDTPVRLSLKGSSTPAAKKIETIMRFGGAPWRQTIKLTTDSRENKRKQPYFVVVARKGEPTDAPTREKALELAQIAQEAEFKLVGDEADEGKGAKRSEKPKGGIDVA